VIDAPPSSSNRPRRSTFRDPPRALGLEDPRGALDLVEVTRERGVASEAKVLASQLVQGRPECAHASTLPNVRSATQ
jgi:hypothetical protein